MSILISRRCFSQVEQDILIYLLGILPETANVAARIFVVQMTKKTGRNYSLAELQAASLELGSRGVQVSSPAGPRQYWLFDSCTFLLGKGTIEFYLSTAGLAYLRELTTQYTSEQVRLLLTVTGKYARRLLLLYFPLLGPGSGTLTYTLPELRAQLGLAEDGNEIFRQLGHLREKVLIPAIRQLNQIPGYEFVCELVKEGRSYNAVRLQVAPHVPLSQAR